MLIKESNILKFWQAVLLFILQKDTLNKISDISYLTYNIKYLIQISSCMAHKKSYMAYKMLYKKSYTVYHTYLLTFRICNIAFKISKLSNI